MLVGKGTLTLMYSLNLPGQPQADAPGFLILPAWGLSSHRKLQEGPGTQD